MNGTKHDTEAAGGEGREKRGEGREQSGNFSSQGCPMRHYQDLLVWQKGVELAVLCYEVTKAFPVEERYGLTSQIRRAAVSVPSNIAEGHARFHTKEFINYLGIARGSLAELETELIISQHVGLLSEDQVSKVLAMTDEIGRMSAGLRQSLEAKLG